MRQVIHVLWGLLVLSAFPASAWGQANPDSVKLRNDCRLARQILETGQPSPHAEWARQTIGFCGPEVWGASVAAAVRRVRTATDQSELALYWADSQWLRDRHLFEAALEIAGDRSASVPTRVFAFRALRKLLYPGEVSKYKDLVGGFDARGWVRGGCKSGWVHFDMPYDGVALPSNYSEQIRLLAQRVRTDLSEPEDIRTAAACTL